MSVVSTPGAVDSVSTIRQVFKYLLLDASSDDTLEITGASFTADDDHIFGAVNQDYVARELAWYESQSLNVNDFPGGPPPIWRQVATATGLINSNYGYLLYSGSNGHQYKNVRAELQRDRDSRRAIAVYSRPEMHYDATWCGASDFVCTNTVQYLIRDGLLHVVVNMRSNDAVFGYRNDLAWQLHVQRRLAGDLGVDVGTVTWQAGSLHVYPRHHHLVRAFAETGVHDQTV